MFYNYYSYSLYYYTQYHNNYAVNRRKGVRNIEKESLLIDTKPSAIILVPHVFLMLFLIGFFTIIKPILNLLSTNIRITTKRISAKTGILNVVSMDSPISKITGVKVTQSILGKFFNYGTICINVMNVWYYFDYIPDPEKIKEIIMEQVKE